MRMTIELNKEYVAHQLCEYLNILAIKDLANTLEVLV